MTADAQPPTPSPPRPVVGYADARIDAVPGKITVLLWVLGGLHLAIGAPLIVAPVAVMIVEVLTRGSVDPDAFSGVALGLAAGAPNAFCGLAMLVKRSLGTWRWIQGVLTGLCALELVGFAGAAAVAISAKHATEWEALGVLVGAFAAAAASLLFWLHATTKLLLLRPVVRRAFRFEADQPVRLERPVAQVMMYLYVILLAVAVVCYVLR